MRRVGLVAAVALVLMAVVTMVMQGGTPGADSVAAMSSPAPQVYLPPAPPAPVGQPKPQPAPAPALDAAAAKAMADFPGDYSVAVQDLASGDRWVWNPDQWYHPASTIKMPVALYALDQFRAGKLSWQQGITYTKADYESPGGGAFETAPFGGSYPVENLVNRALTNSNNVAVNMLGRYLGWPEIRAWSRQIGGELSRLDDGTPQVTVLSELGWWVYLDQLARQDAKDAELILQPLRAVTYSGRIPAGLPQGTSFLHKFGSYDGYFHDGGIIYAKRPYVLVVLTHGAPEDEADAAIARVSAAVYGIMNGK